MATEPQGISSLTSLAKQIAQKELETGKTNSKETLEALDAVAKMLEAKSGNSAEIRDLAKQVQKLVKSQKR